MRLQAFTSSKPAAGEPRTGVGRHRIGERHPMAEDVVAAPHRPERAKPRGVECFERIEIFVDRLAAFHMHDGCEHAVVHGLADIRRRTAEPPGAGPVEPLCDRRHLQRNVERRVARQRRFERRGIMTVGVRFLQREIAGGRNEDGAEPASKATGLGPRAVDVPLVRAVDELGNRVGAVCPSAPEPQQDVVVTVEYPFHEKKFLPSESQIKRYQGDETVLSDAEKTEAENAC